MTKIRPIVIALLFFTALSCSDTVIVENVPTDYEDAPAVSGYFTKNVLIEDYTGTWCGNCTRVAHAINQVAAQTDKLVTVAIHNGNDPYHFANYQPLKDLISPNSGLELPQSRLNRTIVWRSPEPSNVPQARALTGNNSGLGIAMNSTVANGNINLEVKTKFAQNYTGLKLVVYILENHLIYPQRNYTSYYGAINPVMNFEHNHVLRHSLTDLLGNPFTENTITGQTVTKTFSLPIPSNISNSNNISFVAMVVNSDNLAINSRESHANENQEFQQNP